MTGLQTSRQQVGKRYEPRVGQQPGMLGLMSLWASRCPSRATVAENIWLSEEQCEKESEKRREEVLKKYTWGFVMTMCATLKVEVDFC